MVNAIMTLFVVLQTKVFVAAVEKPVDYVSIDIRFENLILRFLTLA